MTGSHVVIDDPAGEELEGEVITGRRIEILRGRGVEMLPILPELIKRSSASGYVKRSYGRGWRFDSMIASRGCPLVIFASPAAPILHWTARLYPTLDAAPAGHLRLATDTGQLGASAAGLSPHSPPMQASELGAPDENHGWTIRGSAQITMAGDGYLGLSLYGLLSGAQVRWLAVSQTA